MVDPLSYFSFQLVLHDWCNKDRVCGMVHIKKKLCCYSERVVYVAAAGFLSRYSARVTTQIVLSSMTYSAVGI